MNKGANIKENCKQPQSRYNKIAVRYNKKDKLPWVLILTVNRKIYDTSCQPAILLNYRKITSNSRWSTGADVVIFIAMN